MEFDRGQVWWVTLDPTQGSEIQKTRPCVIVVVRPIARARRTLVVIPLTTHGTPRPPLVIPVQCQGRAVHIREARSQESGVRMQKSLF